MDREHLPDLQSIGTVLRSRTLGQPADIGEPAREDSGPYAKGPPGPRYDEPLPYLRVRREQNVSVFG